MEKNNNSKAVLKWVESTLNQKEIGFTDYEILGPGIDIIETAKSKEKYLQQLHGAGINVRVVSMPVLITTISD